MKNSKGVIIIKRTVLILIAAISALSIGAALAAYTYPIQSKATPKGSTLATEPQNNETTYIIYSKNDRILIRLSTEPEPFKTLDVSVRTLPAYDQALLKKGITIYDETELYSLIEDFDS